VLVAYLRDYNRKPYGCIVANGPHPENLGLSLCNPKDRFNKELARIKAKARIGRGMKIPPKDVRIVEVEPGLYDDVNNEVNRAIYRMLDHARRYYKPQLETYVGKMLVGVYARSPQYVFCGVVTEYLPKSIYKFRLNGTLAKMIGPDKYELVHRENLYMEDFEIIEAEIVY
jgi:hypothetical protein